MHNKELKSMHTDSLGSQFIKPFINKITSTFTDSLPLLIQDSYPYIIADINM